MLELGGAMPRPFEGAGTPGKRKVDAGRRGVLCLPPCRPSYMLGCGLGWMSCPRLLHRCVPRAWRGEGKRTLVPVTVGFLAGGAVRAVRGEESAVPDGRGNGRPGFGLNGGAAVRHPLVSRKEGGP